MKKLVSILLLLIMCLSLCACGNEKIIEAENAISALNKDSSYADLGNAYTLYEALSAKQKDSVSNRSDLAKYICLEEGQNKGRLVLTQAMCDKIETAFNYDDILGCSRIEFAVVYYIQNYRSDNKYTGAGDFKITSVNMIDQYTCEVNGTIKRSDKYGAVDKVNFTKEYFALLAPEKELGWKIDDNLRIIEN